MQRFVHKFFLPTAAHTLLYKYIIEHLLEIDSRLLTYYYAACFLKVSSLIERGQSALQMADVIMTFIQSGACVFSSDDPTLFGRMNGANTKHVLVASNGTQSLSVCKHYQTASVIMPAVRLSYNKNTTLSRLLIEISKIYLHAALQCTREECEDFHIISRSLLNALLSCLYLSNKQRKLALIHSENAISSLKKHRIQFCHVERQILPCFDTTLETILGLILLYQHILYLARELPERDRRVDMFTADLLGVYLMSVHTNIYCQFCRSRRDNININRYKMRLQKNRELTTADFLLFHEFYRNPYFSDQRKVLLYCKPHGCKRQVVPLQSVEFNSTRLCRLLTRSAIEHLTAFRVSESRDFSSVRHIVTNDFEAMYAYKCHLYEECFRLCEENVD
jgi:hypothetical protein